MRDKYQGARMRFLALMALVFTLPCFGYAADCTSEKIPLSTLVTQLEKAMGPKGKAEVADGGVWQAYKNFVCFVKRNSPIHGSKSLAKVGTAECYDSRAALVKSYDLVNVEHKKWFGLKGSSCKLEAQEYGVSMDPVSI
jgi:hypothetical protein